MVADNGKRYKVALYPDGNGGYFAGWIKVQASGAYNRAASWRLVDCLGPTGLAVTEQAVAHLAV